MRKTAFALIVLIAAAPAVLARADDPAVAFDEREGNVFFREPDRETRRQIDELISRFFTGAMRQRVQHRRELQSIGYWSVAPLIDALESAETPARAAAALTLMDMHDPRTTEPLRAAVVRETSNPYIGAFSALGLGRRRDAECVAVFEKSLRSSKSQHILRAAVPLALARIHTDEAEQLLVKRFPSSQGNALVRESRVLALGFFPKSALDGDSPEPSARLSSAMRARRRSQRRAAVVAYLVATFERDDTRAFLIDLVNREDAPEPRIPALIGLSRYEDAVASGKLADVAKSAKDEEVRRAAVDLLIGRGDASVLGELLSLARRGSDTRVRGAAVLALSSIDADEARGAVLERIDDRAPLVRAAAAVAAARLGNAEIRQAALRKIGSRLKRGESDRDVRANFETARDVLSARQVEPRWREVGALPLFWQLDLRYPDRLLRTVNLAVESVLDLDKIKNLLSDAEVDGGPLEESGGDGEGEGGGEGGAEGGDEGPVNPRGFEPAGSRLYHTWQELRDLKAEVREKPYFTVDDLPRRRP